MRVADWLCLDHLRRSSAEGMYYVGVPGSEWPPHRSTYQFCVLRRSEPVEIVAFGLDGTQANLVCAALNLAEVAADDGKAGAMTCRCGHDIEAHDFACYGAGQTFCGGDGCSCTRFVGGGAR